MPNIHKHMRSLQKRISMFTSRFRRDDQGIAAVEFAIVAPILGVGLILMVDVGEAVFTKYDVERKMRLAIEGVLRYGDDPAKVLAFANASGAPAFENNDQVSENNAELTIEPYYVCRGDQVAQFISPEQANCPNYETWYEIHAAGSVTTLFGKTFDLSTEVNLLAD